MWFGVFLGAAFAVAIVAVVMLPLGPAEPVTGVVRSLGLVETDMGSRVVAVVQLPQGQTTVSVSSRSNCSAGNPIRLLRYRKIFRMAYVAAVPTCRSGAWPATGRGAA